VPDPDTSSQDPDADMQPTSAKALFMAMLLTVARAEAAEPVSVTTQQTALGRATAAGTQTDASAPLPNGLTKHDLVLARIWGLSTEEMQRANLLLQGPRAAFSAPNLTPIEALGIHARTPQERRKYAEMFAKAHHQDVERVLAWASEYESAMRRLYPVNPAIDFTGVPMVHATPGQADAAKIPAGAYIPVQPDLATTRATRAARQERAPRKGR